MDIAIIGGGPIGCYAGYLLAKNGHSVSIYENHPRIGVPIQCTGILTSDFDQFNFPLDSFLVNTINKIEVYSPKGRTAVKQKDYIVCRTKFDNFFGDLARKAGAQIFLNHSFTKKEEGNLIIRDSINKTEKTITPDLVLAADGPLSPTAKAYGFYHPGRRNYYGIQAVVEGKFESHTIKTYFGEKVCPGLFAWIAPESSTRARVGLATTQNSRYYFDKFIKKHHFTALEMQGGTIPIFHPSQKLQKDNCYLLGDAAGYVKATTLGGLVPGLKQAEVLADCIQQGLDFEKAIKPIRRKMYLHLHLHRIFNRFTDKEWNRLLTYINQPKIQEVLEMYTRDDPIPLVTKALLREPRFLFFAKYLF